MKAEDTAPTQPATTPQPLPTPQPTPTPAPQPAQAQTTFQTAQWGQARKFKSLLPSLSLAKCDKLSNRHSVTAASNACAVRDHTLRWLISRVA